MFLVELSVWVCLLSVNICFCAYAGETEWRSWCEVFRSVGGKSQISRQVNRTFGKKMREECVMDHVTSQSRCSN